jgi:hypothetical protein
MIGELFSGPERKPIGYILSNSKPLIYLVSYYRSIDIAIIAKFRQTYSALRLAIIVVAVRYPIKLLFP